MANDVNEDTPSIVIDSLALTLANRDALLRKERKSAILTYVSNTDLSGSSGKNIATLGTKIH